ncbi:hypothetical protein ACS0TY_033515 [Phlomoides rotata]
MRIERNLGRKVEAHNYRASLVMIIYLGFLVNGNMFYIYSQLLTSKDAEELTFLTDAMFFELLLSVVLLDTHDFWGLCYLI